MALPQQIAESIRVFESTRKQNAERCNWCGSLMKDIIKDKDGALLLHQSSGGCLLGVEDSHIDMMQEDLDIDDHWEESKRASHDKAESAEEAAIPENADDQSGQDSELENDDVGDLAFSQDHDVMKGLYSASMPRAGFFGPNGYRGSPMSSLGSFRNAQIGLASPRSFHTAQSSLASYVTASSGPHSVANIPRNRSHGIHKGADHDVHQARKTVPGKACTNISGLPQVVNAIFERGLLFHGHTEPVLGLHAPFKSWIYSALILGQAPEGSNTNEVTGRILSFDLGDVRNTVHSKAETAERESLRQEIATIVHRFLSSTSGSSNVVPLAVFSSDWLSHLRSRGILLDPKDELDWSGRGQHVEYELKDADLIPLIHEGILGHSATAIVESVKCRRIRLARKKITCHRRLSKEDAVTEVEHLQRLQHSHIVRVVGTYTLKRTLSILLYPATQWNLDEFLDGVPNENALPDSQWGFSTAKEYRHIAVRKFLGCLSNALNFIHSMNVKHMDIKPKNMLVRRLPVDTFKIYIADFGIARAYKSASECETDSPISYTKAYAAPEVVLQEKRGFSADVFSLGCVFIEMMAALLDERSELIELRLNNSGDTCFYANQDVVSHWCHTTMRIGNRARSGTEIHFSDLLIDTLPSMINGSPDMRPSSQDLVAVTAGLCCSQCYDGPEPFEAAEPL